MERTHCLAVMVVAVVTVVSLQLVSSELIELSYIYNKDAPTSPRLRQFRHEPLRKGRDKNNLWVELYDICASEHSGTHIDAPRHHSQHGWTVEAIPVNRLWRMPAVVIDVSKIITEKRSRNYEVKQKDLMDWEKSNGIIPDGAIVFIYTGWSRMVKNQWKYAGLGQNNELNSPGLGKGAAEWLVNHGTNNSHSIGIVGVGIDTLSLDKGQSVMMPAHTTLFAANIYGLENVANLTKLPINGSLVTVLPMRIGNGSGAPARIIAEIEESSGAHSSNHCSLLFALVLSSIITLRVI